MCYCYVYVVGDEYVVQCLYLGGDGGGDVCCVGFGFFGDCQGDCWCYVVCWFVLVGWGVELGVVGGYVGVGVNVGYVGEKYWLVIFQVDYQMCDIGCIGQEGVGSYWCVVVVGDVFVCLGYLVGSFQCVGEVVQCQFV